MQTLLLNSTYEPISFISFRRVIKLLFKGKVERVSAWNEGLRHKKGYDLVCGVNLDFYKGPHQVKYKNCIHFFCSQDCAEKFKSDPLQYLLPSILRLKEYAPRHIKKRRFNRTGVFKRDRNECQYCSQTFKQSELTLDHVLPRSMGGITSWENCVTCCYQCNNVKADRTPKMAGMKLIRKPTAPLMTIWHEYSTMKEIHDDWEHYIIQFNK